MIGTIRKHSSWLWWVIAGLTIISFVWFMGSGPARNNRAGASGAASFGTLYGHEVTPEMYARANNEYKLYYWMQHHQFPGAREGVTEADARRDSYVRLLITEKAKSLGIRVSDDAVTSGAAELMASLGRKGQPLPMEQFAQQVLAPEGLTVADLQNYLRSDIAIQQMVMALGLPGALVTPQDAGQIYDHDNQEISASAVFFSYSNHLAAVTPTPAAVQDFYTKNQAAYREPDRVQVSYVAIELSNYLAAAELKIGKTNLDNSVENVIRQQGMDAVPGAKTVDEAKVKIREFFLRKEEASEAVAVAKDFADSLNALTNFAAAAKEKNLTVHSTAPFANGADLEGLPESFVTAAFTMKADAQPYSGMVEGPNALYFLSLDKVIPSYVPAFEQISSRVNDDYRATTAQGLARNAGAIFQSNVTAQVAAGKTFAQAATAAGYTPVLLKPFSLSSPSIPEAGERAEIRELKEAAFTTPLGKVSRFFPTSEGGFVLSPQALEPIDSAKKTAAMPQFVNQVRQARQQQAFNIWLQSEAMRELRDTPVYTEMTHAAAK